MKTIKVLAHKGATVKDIGALEQRLIRFVGKTNNKTTLECECLTEPTELDISKPRHRAYYLLALKNHDLLPADEATAALIK